MWEFLTFLRTKCAWPERREVRNGRFFGGSGWYEGIRNLYLDPAFAVPLFVAGDSHPPAAGSAGGGVASRIQTIHLLLLVVEVDSGLV